MTDEADYAYGRLPERIHISRPFEGDSGARPRRFAIRVFKEGERHEFESDGIETVLRISPTGRQQVKVLFFEDNRSIDRIIVQRFRTTDGRPLGRSLLSLKDDEIGRLLDLLRTVQSGRIDAGSPLRIEEDQLEDYLFSDEALRRLMGSNPDLVAELVSNELTGEDVVSVGYRKKQVELFRRLLDDADFFDEYLVEGEYHGPEAVWQDFFECNPWILGQSLTLVCSAPLSGRKLEQVVGGSSVTGGGKRVDAL